MNDMVEVIFLLIEDMICPVHGQKIANLGITETEKISFSPCCEDFGKEVNEVIYCTINDWHGAGHLNKPRGDSK